MIWYRADCGSDLENVFDQFVNGGAAEGAWPVGAGRIVTLPGAADGFVDPFSGDPAGVDPLVS